MSPFVSRLVAEFAAKRPKEDLNEECLAASEAIFKFRNTDEGTPEVVGLQEVDINDGDVAGLTSAVKSFIEAFPDHPSVGSAICALSALDEEALVPFFVEQIRVHYLKHRLHPVQQADYALCRLGQDFPRYDYASGESKHDGYWAAVQEFLLRHPKT
jgi:hypothetical protein